MNGHVALLGDSVFDNGAYTSGGPDVITQVRSLLRAGLQATLLAVDGSMIADLDYQVSELPTDATHLVVSVGGNDVLMNLDVLRLRVKSEPEALVKLGQRASVFERAFRKAIDRVVGLGLETAICTIYNGNLAEDGAAEAMGLSVEEASAALVALTTFNDAILRVAFQARLRVIDLRLVCNEPADYANPIEPSSRGGEKIARAVVAALGLTERTGAHSRVFG